MRSTVAVMLVAAWLSGCASIAPGPADPAGSVPTEAGPIAPFSSMRSLDPGGPWVEWMFHPTKKGTRFRSVTFEDTRVIEAFSDRSISGLKHRLDIDPGTRPVLEWRWRVETPVTGTDVSDRQRDDSPVRIVLAFDGDRSSLPLKEQMFFERVKLLGGQEMPYATLMYVWCNRNAVEAVTPNAHTTRVRKIVVEKGEAGVGTWRTYRRDVVADYERAYGVPPGRLIAVGIMSDTDNTRQTARSWYGDIRLLPRTD